MARQQLPDGFWVDINEQTGQMVPIDPATGAPTGGPMSAWDLFQHQAGAAASAVGNAIPRTPPGTVSPHPLPGVPGGVAGAPPSSIGPVGAGGPLPGGIGGGVTPQVAQAAGAPAAPLAPEDDPNQVPVDSSVSNPTPSIPAGSNLNQTLLAWAKAHGGIASPPSTVKIKINPQTGAYTDKNEQAHPYSQYMFGDGSRLVINDQGGQPDVAGWTVDASTRNKALAGFINQYGEQVGNPAVDEKRSPNWPNDPNPYWTYHFKNGSSVTMNGSGDVVNITKGQEGYEGQTRSNVQNGYEVQEVFRGGQWVPDTSVPPKPWTPKTQAEPTEGQTRTNVQNGYQVQEVYRNGNWVPDTTVAPRPWTPEAQASAAKAAGTPTEGLTRSNVQNGYQVQEVYRNGQWVPDTSVAPRPWTPEAQASAAKAAGAPTEGQTRPNVQNGYQIQEVYRGGQWVVDPSVPAKRFTPQAPQQVTASSTEPYLTMYNPDTGQYTQQPNLGFIPKTQADVAARVGQLQQAATAQKDQLAQQQRAGVITADEATQKFDQWWQQNVESQKGALVAAQQQAQLADQQKQQDLARANLATAQTAGTEAVRAIAGEHRVGPGFGNLMSSTLGAYANKQPMQLSGQQISSAFVTPMPNYQDIFEKATAQALQHISPTAAQITTGQPVPTGLAQAQGMDINAQLNPTTYRPAFPPPPAPAAATAADVSARIASGLGAGGLGPLPPSMATPPAGYDWQALQQRLAADQAAQQAQAQAWPYQAGLYQPSF